MRIGVIQHIPLSRGNFNPPQISGFGLYLPTQGRVCARRPPCVFCVRFRGPVVCTRRRWATTAERGSEACAWAPWAAVWIRASLTDGWSLNLSFFLRLSCSVLPQSLPPPPPCVDEDISSGKQRRAKNKSLCARGMHKTGENMPLKRC